MTTKCIQIQAKLLYNKLIATNIYNDKGERLTQLKDLTDQHIEPLLLGQDEDEDEDEVNEGDLKCIFGSCGRLFRNNNDLVMHLTAAHVPENEHAGTEANVKEFKASNGWVDRFKDRHNLHNIVMCGEKVSCDYEGAEKYVSDLRAHLIELQLLPEEVMNILINIDECCLQWKFT